MFRMTLAAAALAALFCVGVGRAFAAGAECDTASKDFDRAQQALSRTTRDADTTAAAYAQCKEKGGACGSQKAAYASASAAKTKALEALRVAATKRQSACP